MGSTGVDFMPFLFSFRAVEANSERKHQGGKGSAATPPPWFPPLESPFRGAPSARNDQRGKPIPTSASKAKFFSPSWSLGEWRKPFVVCPSGHSLCIDLFLPWPSARAAAACPSWPLPCGASAREQKPWWWFWISGPGKARA
jgi:hypothetical protein